MIGYAVELSNEQHIGTWARTGFLTLDDLGLEQATCVSVTLHYHKHRGCCQLFVLGYLARKL